MGYQNHREVTGPKNYAKYLIEFEKYKDVPLPTVGDILRSKSEPLHKKITYRVDEVTEDSIILTTIHSGRQQSKTHHWVRKNTYKE